ncbi:MAG: T9SS type A sorting domain-containing protein, partial [Cyclobacteriaceae bacterium]
HSDNLAYISGQGTDNYVVTKTASGEGIGWVQATINGPCGQVVLPQKQVWVGSPELDGYISGSSSVNCDGISIYEYTGGVYGDQDIRWEVSLQFDDVSSVAGYELFVDPTNEGDGYVTFVASNSCGEAILCKPVSVSGVSCGPGYINFPNPYSCGGSFALSAEEDDITIYPNPADQELSILNLPEGVEVIMFNKGMEALHTGYTGNEEPYCIPLSHLRADVYFLHLLMGEERVIRQVVVEHE